MYVLRVRFYNNNNYSSNDERRGRIDYVGLTRAHVAVRYTLAAAISCVKTQNHFHFAENEHI